MAASALIEWDVASTGLDTNGGGFKAGATGTDFSQQDAAQYALTGIASAGAGNVFLTASAAADMVGNVCQVISGTNYTVGLFEITSVSLGVSVTVATNNAGTAICTGVGANGVINIGGRLATPNAIMSDATACAAGQTIHIKNATYTRTTTISLGASGSEAVGWITVRGYNAAHNDITTWAQLTANSPIFTTATNSIAKISTNSKSFWIFEAFRTTDTAATRGIGISCTGASAVVAGYLLQFDGCLTATGVASGTFTFQGDMIESKNCTSFAWRANGTILSNAWLHASAGGYTQQNGGSRAAFSRVYFTDNTTHGLQLSGETVVMADCVVANNTGGTTDGIQVSSALAASLQLHNTILYGNGRYNLNNAVASVIGPNYSNSWGGAGTANVNGTGATTGKNPITLTVSPFTAAGDYSLNNTAGGGAACRALGVPGIFPGAAFTGYADVGGIQHQDSGGSGGIAHMAGAGGGFAG